MLKTEASPTAVPAIVERRCPSADDSRCLFGEPEAFPDRSGMIGDVSVVRCRCCGIGITQPPLADVTSLYADRKSQDFQPNTGKFIHAIKSLAFRRQARALVRQVGGRSERVVDFGCGSGLFTQQLSEMLPASEVIGADFHDRPPADLTESSYLSFDRLQNVSGTADLVLAMHVLEHDDDSRALLARIVDLAKPGGRIVLEVPNIDCVWAPLFGRRWDAWYLPYHRVHFTRMSLRSLVESAGLTVELEAPACVPTMGRSIANLLGWRNSIVFVLVGVALHPIQWIAERITQRSSALRIVARLPNRTEPGDG